MNAPNSTLFPETEPNVGEHFLTELVGPGKKFKDTEELAKGKWYADAAIAVKDKQLDDYRELILEQRKQIDASQSLEQLLDQLKQRELADSKTPIAREVTETKLNPEDIKSLVSTQLKQAREEEKGQLNISEVQGKIRDIYGDKASEFLRNKQQELGLSGQDVIDLAKKSPTALYNLLGLNAQQKETFQAPPRTERRSDSFAPTTEKRTWSWYKTKYKNRDFINDRDLNNRMAQDAADLGDAFFDGDFYNNYHQKGQVQI